MIIDGTDQHPHAARQPAQTVDKANTLRMRLQFGESLKEGASALSLDSDPTTACAGALSNTVRSVERPIERRSRRRLTQTHEIGRRIHRGP